MNVIITGSTGMVGKGVLLECVESEHVDEILLINRSPIGEEFPKTKEVLVQDFFNLTPFEEQLKGYDACYFSLGTTSVGKTEEEYARITYDLTLNFARTVLEHNPGMVFTYVSGTGTSTKMNSKMMWANVKGKTENDLLDQGFKDAYMFRPGIILPLKGIRSKMWYQYLYDVMLPLYPLFSKMKSVTDTVKIGQAMIRLTLNPQDKKILEPEDINEAAGEN